jgi:hypothetical protein
VLLGGERWRLVATEIVRGTGEPEEIEFVAEPAPR